MKSQDHHVANGVYLRCSVPLKLRNAGDEGKLHLRIESYTSRVAELQPNVVIGECLDFTHTLNPKLWEGEPIVMGSGLAIAEQSYELAIVRNATNSDAEYCTASAGCAVVLSSGPQRRRGPAVTVGCKVR